MKLSVIVTAHNKASYLHLLLKHMRAGLPCAQFVLVDDGSTDKTGEIMERFADTFIRTEDVWETKANNVALREATGEYIAIIQDDDLIVTTDWLTICTGAMADLNLGILSGRATGHWYFKSDGKGVVDQSAWTLNEHEDTLILQAKPFEMNYIRLDCFLADKAITLGRKISYGIYQCETTIRSPFIISRRLIDSIGILDEAYAPLFYDDHDYCMRARRAGFTIAFTLIPQKSRFSGGSHWLYGNEKEDFLRSVLARNQRNFSERYAASFPPFEKNMSINRIGSLSFTPADSLLYSLFKPSAPA